VSYLPEDTFEDLLSQYGKDLKEDLKQFTGNPPPNIYFYPEGATTTT
jgi:hypothetical protein